MRRAEYCEKKLRELQLLIVLLFFFFAYIIFGCWLLVREGSILSCFVMEGSFLYSMVIRLI